MTDVLAQALVGRFDTLPQTVYKYRRVDSHALKYITDGTIYFASARDFNDPFDTSLGYDFEATDDTKFWYTNRILKRHHPELGKKARRREARRILDEVNAAGPERNRVAQDLLLQQRYEQLGIFCAARIRDDLLMWAHYASNHGGICLGLRRSVLARSTLVEMLQLNHIVEAYNVEYQDELVRPLFFSTPPDKDRQAWHGRVVAVKSSHWAYEQEIRLVRWAGANAALDCGPNLVSEVVLGCRISEADEALVLGTLRRTGSTATVYRARRHDHRFELVLDLLGD